MKLVELLVRRPSKRSEGMIRSGGDIFSDEGRLPEPPGMIESFAIVRLENCSRDVVNEDEMAALWLSQGGAYVDVHTL